MLGLEQKEMMISVELTNLSLYRDVDEASITPAAAASE